MFVKKIGYYYLFKTTRTFNKLSEIFYKCRHENNYLLKNFRANDNR